MYFAWIARAAGQSETTGTDGTLTNGTKWVVGHLAAEHPGQLINPAMHTSSLTRQSLQLLSCGGASTTFGGVLRNVDVLAG